MPKRDSFHLPGRTVQPAAASDWRARESKGLKGSVLQAWVTLLTFITRPVAKVSALSRTATSTSIAPANWARRSASRRMRPTMPSTASSGPRRRSTAMLAQRSPWLSSNCGLPMSMACTAVAGSVSPMPFATRSAASAT